MVVDDEPMISGMLKVALEQLGYVVTAFHQPELALARFESGPIDFDLLITDYRMPNLDGLSLAARVRALSPAVGLILISGYSVPLNPAQLRQLDLTAQVGKPFEISALAAIIEGFFANQKSRLLR